MESKLKEIGNDKTCPIAVIIRDGKILTGHRHYTKANTKHDWKEISVWTIPGGRCDPGETIEETLRREVQEEVGITEFDILDFIGEVPGAKEGDIVPIFFCKTMQDAKLMEPEKFSEWRWLPKEKYIAGELYSGFNPIARKTIVDFLKKYFLCYNTPMNKVTHFEFPWDDKERAKSFYQNVFGWKPTEWEQFGYTSWQTGAVNKKMQPTEPGFINGGSSKRDPSMPYPMFYIDVPDIDIALADITKNGGSVVRGKTPLGENGEMGFLAWFKDSEGNILGLSQYKRRE